MSIKLTDAQIARVFDLCDEIGRVRASLPVPPQGFEHSETAALESAKNLRANLEKHNNALLELGTLLRSEPQFAEAQPDAELQFPRPVKMIARVFEDEIGKYYCLTAECFDDIRRQAGLIPSEEAIQTSAADALNGHN